jgi:hypothetical protein
MHVFVDANILLEFYGLSPKELEELRKLVALIDAGELTLWLPDCVVDEVKRNREKVLADATRPLRDSRLKISFPEISYDLPERKELEDASRETQKKHSSLLEALDLAIEGRALEADKLLNDLFAKAKVPKTTPILQRARDRRDLRRPPGKADSLGDVINWEALLVNIPNGDDIHIVSADSDFRSPLGEGLRQYLVDEWDEDHGGSAHLYRSLGAFSKEHFPALDLATDVPKLRAINELASSPNFAYTHAVVARLSDFDIFTPDQARLLLTAAAENSQVRWIARDTDVYELLRRVIDAHRAHVDPNIIAVLEREMHPPGPSHGSTKNDDDLPF